MNEWFLTLLIFTPLAGALLTLLLPKNDRLIRTVATVVTAIPLVLVLLMLPQFNPGQGMQFVQKVDWIPSMGVSYHLGVDGFGFAMIALSALLFFLAALASKSIDNRVRDYFALFLLLEAGTIGVFAALDFVLFYVFWEIVLLPMYFLIGIWGGARREYAAIKFFIYTLVGSVVMLVAFLAMYFNVPNPTFNLLDLAAQTQTLSVNTLTWFGFLGLLFGFAVKVPMFPFHTWLPDAHVEAPTPISMLLAGILLKLGTYAMLRISHALLPQVAIEFAPYLAALGIAGIVYGALAAMAQKDMKKMVAYSSVSHMGYFIMGLAAGTPEAISAAFFITISHGLISAAFFFVVGMFYERTHTREIDKMGGMFLTVPAISFVMAFVAFANLGLPGLAGFIGEFFALLGSYPKIGLWVLAAGFGLVITGAFHLILMRKVLLGEKKPEWQELSDITFREVAIFAPLGALILLFGVYPAPIFNLIDPAVTAIAKLLGGV